MADLGPLAMGKVGGVGNAPPPRPYAHQLVYTAGRVVPMSKQRPGFIKFNGGMPLGQKLNRLYVFLCQQPWNPQRRATGHGVITGFVRYADDSPVAGASVLLLNEPNGDLYGSTTTNADGKYEFRHVPIAPYTIVSIDPQRNYRSEVIHTAITPL